MRELYEADLHEPGIYGIGEVWANAWNVIVARSLELVAVAGLLWISWCVLGAADFFVFFFFKQNTAYEM